MPTDKNAVHLDFETYSEAPLLKVGAYRYARHPSTEVLIACYWLPGMDRELDEPRVWLPRTQRIPADLLAAVNDKRLVFFAHSAQFERSVWKWVLRRMHPKVPDIPVERWMCTAAIAAASGLARKLEVALTMLGTGVEKDPEGTRLIKLFSVPRKPTKANSKTRNMPEDFPADFRKFILYCQRDVLGELELHEQLPPLHPDEQRFFHLDMHMNERGLPIDIPLVHKAQIVLKVLEDNIRKEVEKLTGGIRATQRDKFLGILNGFGLDMENLQAQTVRDVLKDRDDLPDNVKRLLLLRVEAGKVSTKKLASMALCADPTDHVVQGSFLFHGAHTGRYAGRLVQPQNYIRGNLKPVQMAVVFALLEYADPAIFQMLYEWPIDVISQCLRGFIQAPEGYRFVVVDYTAIEARVLAWVAGEERVLAAYRRGMDVYKIMASRLFKITVEEVSSEQRRIGKNLVLGCGYSLGGKRFVDYSANAGVIVTEDFAVKAVKLYRADHPAIVQSWADVEQAAAKAIRNPGTTTRAVKCTFRMRQHWLCVKLPSGRELRYPRAKAVPIERWGRPAWQISFQTELHGRAVRENTYGGKLIENIVQAISRDIMREGMFAAEDAGYPVVGTVHDELLTLRKHGEGSSKELEHIVCDLPAWTQGIPLGAEGFETIRYRKG